MASQYLIERDRGTKEASQQLAVLRERWPLAFPVKDEDVRPLAISANEIAGAMGWSRPYTLGVLRHWKMTAAYCQAILRHDQRIALDGAPAEPVGADAKDLAAKQLARLAARKAATKAAKAAAPAAVKPPPGPNRQSKHHPRRRSNCGAACARRALAPERITGAADQLPLLRPA
jgi:sRNA-binding protein